MKGVLIMFNVNEAVDELIDDINVDYYESCYDAIYEELCNRVESGELTIEEAEMINDAAAEKYLTEGNAYNRVLNKRAKEVEQLDKRISALQKLKDNYGNSNTRSKFSDKLDKKILNYTSMKDDFNILGKDYLTYPAGYKELQNKTALNKFRDSKRAREGQEELRTLKQDWMSAHGNKGLKPEERYKAGRYLKAQKEINSKK